MQNEKEDFFKNHLRVNLSEGDPPSLHPQLASDIRGRMIGKSLFEGLTRLGKNGVGELAAAEKIEIDPSCTRYVFFIRDHLWSNGEVVTAHQFEKAWKQAIHPESVCARSDLFYIIKNAKKAKCRQLNIEDVGVKAINDKVLVVELENPAPYFLELISHPIFSPVYNDEKEPSVFNGPFMLGKWQRGSVLEFIKNSLYWDANNVNLDKVSIFMVPDVNTENVLFEKNKLDVIGDCFDSFPLDILPSVMKDPNFNTQEISRIYWLYINTNEMPFLNEKIRLAFAYAINRKDLTDNFLIGDSSCNTILPKTLTLVDKDTYIIENTEIAREMFREGLAELGLTQDSFPCITLSYCTYGSQKSLSELLQERLQNVLGIQVTLQSLEWNVLLQNMVHGQFQIASCMRNAIYEDPLYFLEIFKEKSNSYNYARWEDEEYKNLLTLAISSSDQEVRKSYLREAETRLLKSMPVIPIYTETCKYLVKENLEGYYINNSGYVDFKAISFKN